MATKKEWTTEELIRASERIATFNDALKVIDKSEGDMDLANWQLSERIKALKHKYPMLKD